MNLFFPITHSSPLLDGEGVHERGFELTLKQKFPLDFTEHKSTLFTNSLVCCTWNAWESVRKKMKRDLAKRAPLKCMAYCPQNDSLNSAAQSDVFPPSPSLKFRFTHYSLDVCPSVDSTKSADFTLHLISFIAYILTSLPLILHSLVPIHLTSLTAFFKKST